MNVASLSEHLTAQAQELSIPGAAAGVLLEGEETYACFGVTNIESPVEVDENTLFHIGSLTKTVTATALMSLVDRGDVELEAPVRTYLPEFRLQDEDAAARVTILQILNHTSGWEELRVNTGEGDDALAQYVAQMAGVAQVTPPGARAAYNNPAYSIAARVVELVTETSYEQALHDLLFEPLEMTRSFFTAGEAITYRVCAGHNVADDGTITVTRPWKGPRAWNAYGELTSTVVDLLKWARFHLGDGGSVMSAATLRAMQQPTAELLGSELGDAVGIGWMLREIDGVHAIGHDGSLGDQFSAFLMVPSRSFAALVLANASPNGMRLTREVLRWAMAEAIGVHPRDPEPLPFDETQTRKFVGIYENNGAWVRIGVDGGAMYMGFEIKPEMAALYPNGAPTYKPFGLGLLPSDQFLVLDGPFAGLRGVFRSGEGEDVSELEFVGRHYRRS